MKLKALRGFRVKKAVTGQMIDVGPGQIFELDLLEESGSEKEQIISLLQSRRAYVVDETFLPAQGTYVATITQSERRKDGSLLLLSRGQTLTLDQQDASHFLMIGWIRREKEGQWSPRNLISGQPAPGSGVKKMFDEVLEERETFAMKGVRRT